MLSATWHGFVEASGLILAHFKVTPSDIHESRQYSPLHRAALDGHRALVELFASAPGVDVHAVDEDGDTPLHIAAGIGYREIVEYLLRHQKLDAHVNIRNRDGQTALFRAAMGGHCATAQCILSTPGIVVNVPDNEGDTPLHTAALEGHREMVECLLAVPSGVSVNSANDDGQTALHLVAVASHRHCETAECLLSVPGVNVNAATLLDETPLHYAACLGRIEIVRQLLSTPSIDSNALNYNGETPLHLAARRGHREIIELLVSSPGVCVSIVNQDRRTPADVARFREHHEVVGILEPPPPPTKSCKTDNDNNSKGSSARDGRQSATTRGRRVRYCRRRRSLNIGGRRCRDITAQSESPYPPFWSRINPSRICRLGGPPLAAWERVVQWYAYGGL